MKINISSEIKRFKDHLDIPNNEKIIFSGIFGIGKTYFLREFFDGNNDYEAFFIEPVNYSISKNDDIINYIKYDISFELLSKGVDFEKINFSTFDSFPSYIDNHVIEIIKILAKNSGNIGKGIKSIIEVIEKIQTHNDNLQIDEKKDIENFLKKTTEKENSIYHENLITELLTNKIESLKSDKKKTVLIIDDLDRIDPEHIFRLFNVFASHVFDKNKFGFDKIILVCDINNIRNIFSSRYGQNVDFSGYIDKFYSQEVFVFNNKKVISESIPEILNSIKLLNNIDGNPFNSRNIYGKLLYGLLDDFIQYDLINLRSLLKNVSSQISLPIYHFKYGSRNVQSNHNNPMIIIFDVLKLFFGSLSSLDIAIDKYDKKGKSIYSNEFDYSEYGILMMFVDIKNNKSENGKFTYQDKEQDIHIEYDIFSSGYVKHGNILKLRTYQIMAEKNEFPKSYFIKKAFIEYVYINNNKA